MVELPNDCALLRKAGDNENIVTDIRDTVAFFVLGVIGASIIRVRCLAISGRVHRTA